MTVCALTIRGEFSEAKVSAEIGAHGDKAKCLALQTAAELYAPLRGRIRTGSEITPRIDIELVAQGAPQGVCRVNPGDQSRIIYAIQQQGRMSLGKVCELGDGDGANGSVALAAEFEELVRRSGQICRRTTGKQLLRFRKLEPISFPANRRYPRRAGAVGEPGHKFASSVITRKGCGNVASRCDDLKGREPR